jgi:hypothetical protein
MEDVGIFSAIYNILWPFGIFYCHFFPVLVCFWYEKSGNPISDYLGFKGMAIKLGLINLNAASFLP